MQLRIYRRFLWNNYIGGHHDSVLWRKSRIRQLPKTRWPWLENERQLFVLRYLPKWYVCELVGRYLEGQERGGGGGCNWLYGCIPPESYSVFQAGCIYIAEISHVENVNELILNWALVTQADNTLAGEKPTWSQLVVFQVFSITHLRLFCFLSTGSLLSCVTLFLAVWRFVKT